MKKYTFTFSILTLFAALTLLLSVFLMGNFFIRGMKQAYRITENKISEANRTISNTLTETIQSASTSISILLYINSDDSIIESADMYLRGMWEQLNSGKHISSIFLADETGNFLQARRSPKLAVRVIDRTAEKPTDTYYFKDTGYGTVGEEISPAIYDPRTRSWYKNARAHEISWSEPYIFASTGKPGITLSTAVFDSSGRRIRTVAADYSTESLSAMLKSKSGVIKGDLVMFAEDGNVIAASFDLRGETVPTLEGLTNPAYKGILDNARTGKMNGSLKGSDDTYEYFIEKLPEYTGQKWYLASFVKRSVILNEIRQTMLATLLISVLIIGITYFPVLYVLKRLFINPIEKLKGMTDEVCRKNYDKVKRIDTVVEEFHGLSDSMVNMSASISRYEAELKELMDSFIKIIAGAIDAKSKYTAGHCLRVPELAIMIAETLQKRDDEAFKDFRLETDAQWREFSIAAWMHDCGKVTTPEYVVDKATKLEAIHNRIHEIRTRFEVLHRDAQIDYYEKLQKDPEKEAELKAELEKACAQLQDDFSFIAKCNVGGEFMDDADIERLRNIAEKTWIRNFDDRQGLSIAENQRLGGRPPVPVPAVEKLLADKPEHLIEREYFIDEQEYREFGFQTLVPRYAFNYGEVYNLSVKRGTLTEEERYKINEHIIMTIKMLSALPLPENMKHVPEYAGGHHETMDGKGYPRRLYKSEISIPARIIAIADIFEALTAADRPYKKPKTLSESLRIMEFMKKGRPYRRRYL